MKKYIWTYNLHIHTYIPDEHSKNDVSILTVLALTAGGNLFPSKLCEYVRATCIKKKNF